jgi:antitoxin YefM
MLTIAYTALLHKSEGTISRNTQWSQPSSFAQHRSHFHATDCIRGVQAKKNPPHVQQDVHSPAKDFTMDTITYTTARAHLATTMSRVCQDHEALIITRNGQPSVVMMSLEDYKALEETAYLLHSPKNARRLLSAVDALTKGGGQDTQ